ncbi:hypothetical protein BC830DRAFT_1083422 [Chytriomyces sp. MP71]|nr:hypothetical protein BC830DRAFT_1083422 [Chytriomyces sp. MP71]
MCLVGSGTEVQILSDVSRTKKRTPAIVVAATVVAPVGGKTRIPGSIRMKLNQQEGGGGQTKRESVGPLDIYGERDVRSEREMIRLLVKSACENNPFEGRNALLKRTRNWCFALSTTRKHDSASSFSTPTRAPESRRFHAYSATGVDAAGHKAAVVFNALARSFFTPHPPSPRVSSGMKFYSVVEVVLWDLPVSLEMAVAVLGKGAAVLRATVQEDATVKVENLGGCSVNIGGVERILRGTGNLE